MRNETDEQEWLDQIAASLPDPLDGRSYDEIDEWGWDLGFGHRPGAADEYYKWICAVKARMRYMEARALLAEKHRLVVKMFEEMEKKGVMV